MRLEINDDDFRALPKQTFRAAAYFLLHVIGDLDDETGVVPVGTSVTRTSSETATAGDLSLTKTTSVTKSAAPPPPPPPSTSNTPPPPPPPTAASDGDYDDETGEAHDTGTSNVVQGNFPQAGSAVPPPPPGANTAAAPTQSAPAANGAAAAGAPSGVVSAEFDSAGMQYDDRIHQKAKGKKKDGTWKLIKGVDTALVQSVTAELAARKASSVSLPPSGNSVPVPPVSGAVPPAPSGVSTPTANGGSSVPVPPAPAVGSVGASPYRALIDKITELTKASKIAPAKVMEVCQSHGAPSLMALSGMQEAKSPRDPGLTVIQAVDRDIDAAALGLL
jgi:hypothetical protein